MLKYREESWDLLIAVKVALVTICLRVASVSVAWAALKSDLSLRRLRIPTDIVA